MKKIILLMALVFSSNVFGYTLKIVNNTSSGIKVYVTYDAPGWCNDDSKFVEPNKKEIIHTSLCCPNNFKVTGTSGPLRGKTKSISTNMCNHTFTITQDGDAFKIDDKKS